MARGQEGSGEGKQMIESIAILIDILLDVFEMLCWLIVFLARGVLEVWDLMRGKGLNTTRTSNQDITAE
jgi:hypothetical protein